MFQDGAIRGLNVAQMIRSLTSSTLSGWQEGKEQATDLSQLSASFKIDKGQAATTDLNLVGPLVRMTGVGTIDLGTKQIGVPRRAETGDDHRRPGPRRRSGRLRHSRDDRGPWAEPRIYPDMQGILDNPDAAYAKLKEMGKGLFGPDGAGLGGLGRAARRRRRAAPAARRRRRKAAAPAARPDDLLGGKLGETIGNLLQQGLSGEPGPGRRSRGRASRQASARSHGRSRVPPPGRRRPSRPRPRPRRASRCRRSRTASR